MPKDAAPKSKSPVFDAIASRRTTCEFTAQAPRKEEIEKILEAGRWAPSVLNLQPWNFVVVRDGLAIQQLKGMAVYGRFHSRPPIVVAIVLEKDCIGPPSVKDDKMRLHDAYMSVSMPALCMALAAAELGIDSCLLTPDEDTAKLALRLKENEEVPIVIGLGHKVSGLPHAPPSRKSLKEIVRYA